MQGAGFSALVAMCRARMSVPLIIGLALSACAQPPTVVALDAARRAQVRTIALLPIEQPDQVTVRAVSSAGIIASSIPGLGVLGAAMVAGTVAAAGRAADGTLGSSEQSDYNSLIGAAPPDFAAAFARQLTSQLESRGFAVIVATGQKPVLRDDKKTLDYSRIRVDANALLHVSYREFGFRADAFSTKFLPRVVFDVKLLDGASKAVLYSNTYALADEGTASRAVNFVQPGKLAAFDGFAALKASHQESFNALLAYQAFMARRVAQVLAGEKVNDSEKLLIAGSGPALHKAADVAIAPQAPPLAAPPVVAPVRAAPESHSPDASLFRRVDMDGSWSGKVSCGPFLGNGKVSSPQGFEDRAAMRVADGSATLSRGSSKFSEAVSGRIADDFTVSLQGQGAFKDTPDKPWVTQFSGRFSVDDGVLKFSGNGRLLTVRGVVTRECTTELVRKTS